MPVVPMSEQEKMQSLYFLGYPVVAGDAQPVLAEGIPMGLRFQIDNALVNMNQLRNQYALDRIRGTLADLETARCELEKATCNLAVDSPGGGIKMNRKEMKQRRRWYNNLKRELAQLLGVRIIYDPFGSANSGTYSAIINH